MPETRTKEQMDADDALEVAIQRCADAYQMSETGAGFMFQEFLMIAYWASLSEDRGTYHWLVNGRAVPRHHIQGLYKMLGDMLRLEFDLPEEE